MLQTSNPFDLDKISNSFSSTVRWEHCKREVLTDIIHSRWIHEKEQLKNILFKTGEKNIYMNSQFCSIVCTGISSSEFRWRTASSNSIGRNLLGEIYMEIREKLNKEPFH